MIERRGRTAVADNGALFGLDEVPTGIPMLALYIRMLAYAWGEPAAATGPGLVR